MAFMKLLDSARKKYSKVDKLLDSENEIDIPVYNVLNNSNYTKKETDFINNVVNIAKTIFEADDSYSKYELHIYEDILLDTISNEICIKIAKDRIRDKCNSQFMECKVDQMNFLLNNEEFLDYFVNFLKSFKIKVKILSNINDFLLVKMKENGIDEETIEVISLINKCCITEFDKNIVTSYTIIEEYITRILTSNEFIDFNIFFGSVFS